MALRRDGPTGTHCACFYLQFRNHCGGLLALGEHPKRQNCESDSKKASLHISWLPWYRLQWDMENGTRQNHPIFIFFLRR